MYLYHFYSEKKIYTNTQRNKIYTAAPFGGTTPGKSDQGMRIFRVRFREIQKFTPNQKI